MSDSRYYRLSKYLKERFGGRVHRLTLEAGFTCPNIDGSKSTGGCTFCTEDGSSSGARIATDSISKQLIDGISKQGRRFRTDKFIAYLQSFTNTYGEIDYLEQIYDQAVNHPSIKVLAIGSRPDCVPDEVLSLIEKYTSKGIEVWLDIGVQSSHDISLERINRAHSWKDFTDAVSRIKVRKNPLLRVCTHVILGLPGESPEMMLQTAERIAVQEIDDIKIHQLCIFKGTPMEKDFLRGEIRVLEEDEYMDLLAEFIRRLPPRMLIQRLMGEGKNNELIAPLWAGYKKKDGFLIRFNKYLETKDYRQGDLYKLLP
jgi:uncharacterized protein